MLTMVVQLRAIKKPFLLFSENNTTPGLGGDGSMVLIFLNEKKQLSGRLLGNSEAQYREGLFLRKPPVATNRAMIHRLLSQFQPKVRVRRRLICVLHSA